MQLKKMNLICSPILGIVLFGLGIAGFSGCSRGPTTDDMFQAANDSNIKRITSLYLVFQSQNGWIGPADESTFKTFIESLESSRLRRLGIDPDNIGAVFVSERDGQPFKIRWGIEGRPRQNPKPLVFESAGVEGVFWVSFPGYLVKEVDKAEYDRLWSGKRDDENIQEDPQRRG